MNVNLTIFVIFVDETAEHVLLECEALGRHRLRALGPPGKEQENIMANPVETILNFIRLVTIKVRQGH